MRTKKLSVMILIFLGFPSFIMAQKFSLSTNIVDYLNFGTLNVSGAYGFSRNWSADFTAKFNPFTYNEGDGDKQMQNRQQAYTLGIRWWPWHLWSGWWMCAGLKYQEYNVGGVLSPDTEEGDRVGASLSAGYSLMVHPHVNIDFGLGFWSGWSRFVAYSCPSCGTVRKSGQRVFLLPDNIMMSLVYVF